MKSSEEVLGGLSTALQMIMLTNTGNRIYLKKGEKFPEEMTDHPSLGNAPDPGVSATACEVGVRIFHLSQSLSIELIS